MKERASQLNERAIPSFRCLSASTSSTNLSTCCYYHFTCSRTLSAMSIPPTADERPSRCGPCQYGISNPHTDNRMTDIIHRYSNTNVGNVLNSYNTINVGMGEESLRIKAWLSPLEPHKRHQDVRNRRLDGVGEWVLRKSEFESWRKSEDGSGNRTLLCYGTQGVGKTYIRYKRARRR